MKSITWYCVPSATTCFTAAVALEQRELLSGILAGVGAILLLIGAGVAVYFALVDPDRLHTEDYHLRRQALEITDAKGKKFEISPVDMTAIANPWPTTKALPPKTSEEVCDADFKESEGLDGR